MHYLLRIPFTIRTDHSSVTWLLNFKDPQGQIARSMEELSLYNMVLEHKAGKKHENADALSRKPYEKPLCNAYVSGIYHAGDVSTVKKAHYQWGSFASEVYDAIPLTSSKLYEL